MLNYRWDYAENLRYQQEQQQQAENARLAELARQNRPERTCFAYLKQMWRQLLEWRPIYRNANAKPAAHKQAYNSYR